MSTRETSTSLIYSRIICHTFKRLNTELTQRIKIGTQPRKSEKSQTRKRKLVVEDTNRNGLIESSDLGIKGIHGKTALPTHV